MFAVGEHGPEAVGLPPKPSEREAFLAQLQGVTKAGGVAQSGHQHHAQHTVRLSDGTAVAFICSCGHDWKNETYVKAGVES